MKHTLYHSLPRGTPKNSKRDKHSEKRCACVHACFNTACNIESRRVVGGAAVLFGGPQNLEVDGHSAVENDIHGAQVCASQSLQNGHPTKMINGDIRMYKPVPPTAVSLVCICTALSPLSLGLLLAAAASTFSSVSVISCFTNRVPRKDARRSRASTSALALSSLPIACTGWVATDRDRDRDRE